MNPLLGLLKWLNPAYPISKLLAPAFRRPEKVLALAGKPVASASAALMQRNQETIEIQLQGDVEGDITITVPYDQDTLEKVLAISLLPQVALLTTAYAIPELQRDLNILWRSATLGKAGNLPRWNATRDLLGRRIKQEAGKEVAEKGAQLALSKGATAKGAATIGAKVGGSFIAGVNVVIWVDTAILAITGIADLLIDEDLEESIGIDIQPFSPLGEVIGSMTGWVANTLGINTDRIVQIGQDLGIDSMVKGGLFLLGDMILDTDNATIDVQLEAGSQNINLDLDGYTLGEIMGLAVQFSAIEEANSFDYDDPAGLFEMFFWVLFSILLLYYGRQFLSIFRRAATPS